MSNATAVQRRERTLPSVPGFTPEQVELVKNTIGRGAGLTDDELALFLTTAHRRGLDPFAKQIYPIKYDGKTLTLVTGIDGYRAVAASVKEDGRAVYAGSEKPVFEETSTGGLYAAEVTVYRMVGGQRCPFVGYTLLNEFKRDSNPEWRKQPRNLLAKCAEAQALRKAFPEELAELGFHAEPVDVVEPPRLPEQRADALHEGPAAMIPPFSKGGLKGKPYGDMDEQQLASCLQWFRKDDEVRTKFAEHEQAALSVLADRLSEAPGVVLADLQGWIEKTTGRREALTDVRELVIQALEELRVNEEAGASEPS